MCTFRRIVGTVSLLIAAPASALACPVCALIGTRNNTWAYQAMTAMLIVLPLAMIGALVWWLARLTARADVQRPSMTHDAATTTSGRAPGGLVVGDSAG